LRSSQFAEELDQPASDRILREPAPQKPGRLAALLGRVEPKLSAAAIDLRRTAGQRPDDDGAWDKADDRSRLRATMPYAQRLLVAHSTQHKDLPAVLHMTARQRRARKMARLIARWVVLTIALVGTVMTMASH